MKFRYFALILPSLLAACAQAPSQSDAVPGSSSGASSGADASALASTNGRAKVHTELAAQYYVRGQYSVALQEVGDAMAADNSYAPAYNMLGLLHGALLEDKEAEDSFRRAISLAPQYSEAHNNYGSFLCSHKRYDQALSEFELAWKNPLYSTPEMALANAGQCALRKGDQERAENLSRRALIRMPNQPQALLTLAEINFQQGNPAMARSLINQVSAQGELDAVALWLGVRVERTLGNRESEAEYGAQLRRRFPNSKETSWLLNGQFDRSESRQ